MTGSAADLPLRDIHLPAPVSWWPPAPGWWLLAALVLGTAGVVVLWRRRRRKRALLRAACAELQRLQRHYQRNGDAAALAEGLSRLLRRACLSRYPRADVAGLSGDAWLRFLDETLEQTAARGRRRGKPVFGGDAPFSEGVGRVLVSAPYQPRVEYDAAALCALCRTWLQGLAQPIGARSR